MPSSSKIQFPIKLPALFLFAVCLLLLSSCKKENTSISGTYKGFFNDSGTQYEIELLISDDGKMEWIPLRQIPGYSSSTFQYSFIDNLQLTITDNSLCTFSGIWVYSVDNRVLKLMAAKDACAARIALLTGEWTRK